MTVDLVELFGRAVGEFGHRVLAVGDQWQAPTPDTEWDVRALVNHVLVEDLWAPSLLAGKTIADVGGRFDGDQLGDDPHAEWAEASRMAIEAVAQEGALGRTVHVSFGDIKGEDYVSQLVCDHLIHAWDLARAVGADERLDTDLVGFALGFLRPQVDNWRASGVFGPRVEVAAGADRQTELLALSGRTP
ncbi:MAG: TIGR03086 family protein [Actinobacteria bacterium]|nr:TIGR03086 family protein [Actinomycetota bacterium]